MPAYFVAIRDSIIDPKEMEIYADKASKSAAGHNMTPKAFYGKSRTMEGIPVDGAVIVEFPTFKEAEAWYYSPEYQEAIVHRFRGAIYRTFIVQGV